jgi:uncharacterized delta-60 repeat protein
MNRRRRLWGGLAFAAGVLMALVAMGVSAAAAGPPGALDAGFGVGGKRTVNFGGTDRATHVAVAPDGRIVAVGSTDATGGGDFAVARLTADGSPDTSFGSSGQTTLGTTAAVNDIGAGVAVLPNEQIVVAGYGGAGQDFITRRLNADGTVDDTFAGTGTSTVDFGGVETVSAMARQPDGGLVLVGSTSSVGGGDFAIARLNADGSPDTGFSGDGRQTVDFGGTDAANAVALTADGKIVVGGQGGPANDLVVTRLNSDGSVDTSFAPAGAGKAFVDFGGTDAANGVAVQPDGKIVLDGSTSAVGSGDAAVARLNADGSLDLSFSGDGKLTLGYGAANEQGLALAVQSNGRILAFAQGGPGSDFELTRLAADGSFDTAFGTSDTATVDFGGAEFDGDVALQSDGQIVTVGSTNATDGGDMAFARLQGDPVTPPPTSTSTSATTTSPTPAPPPQPYFLLALAHVTGTPVIDVAPGQTVTRQIDLFRNRTSVGPITLSARRLTGGVTLSISPSNVTRGPFATATLTVSAPGNALPRYIKTGLITATPSATAGTTAQTLKFGVLVQAQQAVWIDGLEVTQGAQTDDQPRQSDYHGVTLMNAKKTVVRAFVDLQGRSPARAPGSSLPSLSVALYGYTKSGQQLPGSPLLPEWSPPTSSLRRNQPGLPADARESSRSAFVFTLPASWTQINRYIHFVATPVAPQPSTRVISGRSEPLSATFCTAQSCGAQNGYLTGVSFIEPPRTRVMSLVKVRFILNGKFTGNPVPAARAYDKLLALSPVPFAFLNGAGLLTPVPDYSGVFTTSDHILEHTQAYDDANGRQGDFMMGVFAYPPGLGYSPGPRVGVADASDNGTGGAQRPTTIDAHEVFHLLGISHADTACGGSSSPTGFPDPDGRMRSVGLDTSVGSGGSSPGDPPYRVIPDDPPAGNPGWDLMSYCNLQVGDPQHWISAHNWQAVLASAFRRGNSVRATATRSSRVAGTGSFLVLRAEDSGGRVQIDSVLPSTLAALPGTPSAYRLVARDAGGAVLADAPVTAAVAEQGGRALSASAPALASPFTSLEGRVPAAGVARLELVRDGAVVGAISRSPSAPTATLIAPAGGARLHGEKPVTVRWQAADADGGSPSVSVEYSADAGMTYATVAQAQGSAQVVLPAGILASSPRARLRLRITDGFNTTVTTARPVVVLPRAPAVTIIEPALHQRVQGGEMLYLQGNATDGGGHSLAGGQLRWYSGSRLLGSGAMLSAVLPAGARSVRLVARDRGGRTGSATIGVRVQATTPLFLRLSVPRHLSRRARTLTLVVAATEPATLRLGTQRRSVGRRPHHISVHVRPGRGTLRLRFVLAAGGRSSTQYVAVSRQ